MNSARPITEKENAICIVGAREHNLKNITLQIPPGQFVVVTGVSAMKLPLIIWENGKGVEKPA